MSPDDQTAQRAAEAQAAADVLIRREIAEQAGAETPTAQYDGLKITHSEGRYLPVVRSRESLDHALQGDCEMLGKRLRAGAVSHDEREFLDDVINSRIKPGKGLYNQRVAKARRQRVANFVSEMQRQHPQMQLEPIVAEAMTHFRIARSEVFTSLREHKSNEPE